MTASRAVHSNAFNFMGQLQHAVDTRTGQYTVSVDMPELKTNQLCGPVVPLQLQFNPLNTLDSGYGLGWNLNLSQYTPQDHMLSLSSGETFKITGSGAQPAIKEKKLDSFHFYDLGNGTYRVVHKNGLVELLRIGGSDANRVALPVQIFAPSGHSVSLTYVPFRGGQLLETLSDAYGTLLRVERNANDTFIRFHLHPDSGPGGVPLSTFEMQLGSQGEVRQIILPTEEKASWRFQYEKVFNLLCMSEVQTPVGGRETIEYLDEGHAYPGPARDPLPRVTRHRTYPGFGQPMLEVIYAYTDHNFIGNGAPIGWDDDGLDNLYKTAPGYEYGSTATLMTGGLTLRTVGRTFNRFHLQIEEVTTQGDCVQSVRTQYYDQNVSFDQQPPQFQLPKTATTTWALRSDPTRVRLIEERTAFDEYGNPTEKVAADGTRETFSWYSKDGEDGCPPDPHGFVRQQKEQIVYPAPSEHGAAQTLTTRYRYQTLPALSAAGTEDWVVLTRETYRSGDDSSVLPLRVVDTVYHNQPDDPSMHGRPASSKEAIGQHVRTTEHTYGTSFSRLAGEHVSRIVDTLTGSDGCQKVMAREQSMLTGEMRINEDPNGVQIKSDFDAMGRLVRQTVAPGSKHEASRSFTYRLTSQHGQQASQEVTDVTGAKTRTFFDGLRRVIQEEREDKDGGGAWRRTYDAQYDAQGQLAQATEYDWLGDKDLALTQRFEYDDWGQECRVTGSDGISTVTELSPFGIRGPVQRVWQEYAASPGLVSGVSITQFNVLDKPDSIVREDSSGKVVGALHYDYDGKGNCVQQRQELSDMTRITGYEYDAWDRMTATRLPDETVVTRAFAEHSESELPVSLTVTPGNQAEPPVLLGTQTFDSLQRLSELKVGPRVEQYHYQGDSLQISQRITPGKKVFDYTYELELTDQPRSIAPAGDASRKVEYTYDRQTALITGTGKTADDQDAQYLYDSFGHLRHEARIDAGKRRESTYHTSLRGRALASSTSDGFDTRYDYDTLGRPREITQGKLSTTLEYDDHGRLGQRTTVHADSASRLVTTLEYDSLDRELKRTLTLTGQPERIIAQSWYDDDQLHTRDLSIGGQSVCNESFAYDLRGRLEHYSCTGSQLPEDEHGNRLIDQVFRFDALDNIRTCVSQYADGTRDVARLTYAADDSCQLVNVTHSHPSYPASTDFSYDDDGHMLNDEKGNRLIYNDMGRLIEVRTSSNDAPMMTFRYDGHDDLVAVREGTQSETLRFYRGYRLSHTVQDQTLTQCLYEGDAPVGQQQWGDDAQTLLLLADANDSVVGEYLVDGQVHVRSYTPYGEHSDDPLLSLLGYNGELQEAPGWYLLGRGYRAYNPSLMRFHSPDSLSPFGEGGLNPYMYCSGNPISFRDPTGHRGTDIRRPGGDLPDYQDPPEEPKSSGMGWLQWAGVALAVVFVAVSAKVALGTTAFTMKFVLSWAGVATQVAGVGLQVVGSLQNDATLSTVGGALGMLGAALMASPSGWARFSKWRANRYGRNGRSLTGSFDDNTFQRSLTSGTSVPGGEAASGATAQGKTVPSGDLSQEIRSFGDDLNLKNSMKAHSASRAPVDSATSPSGVPIPRTDRPKPPSGPEFANNMHGGWILRRRRGVLSWFSKDKASQLEPFLYRFM